MFIEEEVDQTSSSYDAFYNKYYSGWTEEFETRKEQMKKICKLIDDKEKEVGSYYPLKKDLFRCLEITPLSKVKVVIWGQDPYPSLKSDGKPRAQGYSFGVSKNDVVPKSLINI